MGAGTLSVVPGVPLLPNFSIVRRRVWWCAEAVLWPSLLRAGGVGVDNFRMCLRVYCLLALPRVSGKIKGKKVCTLNVDFRIFSGKSREKRSWVRLSSVKKKPSG